MTTTIDRPTRGLSEDSVKLLNERYLDGGENAEGMFRRVSMGNEDYYNLMAGQLFMPNSPTLFNLGKGNDCTSSACFVFNIGDYMLYHNGKIMEDSIVRTREKAISVAKAGGGVGYYLGDVRPRGSFINSVHRKACGPVAVIRDLHGISPLVTQGGKRQLAQIGVLPVRHADIEEFIDCKATEEQADELSSFNLSASWDNGSVREAFSEEDNPFTPLWWRQCNAAWTTGCPGMFFPDWVNEFNPNPHLGLMLAPNPCGETPNRSDEPCNLGSLAICRFIDLKTRKFNADYFYHCARVATRFLDDILTNNNFPHPDITAAALLTRKLGLGVMGWADFLALQGIKYDSRKARLLADQVWGTVKEVVTNESKLLAAERGPYEGYDGTKTKGEFRRNETNTSIAPTGSIAPICDVWSGIEPYYAIDGERTTHEGLKLWGGMPKWVAENLDGFVPETAEKVSLEGHVLMQAAFQRHTDLGVSKTINLPNSATAEDVSRAYKMMWENKCKGGTVYRDGSRSQQVLRKKKPKKTVFSMADGEEWVPDPQAPVVESEQLSALRKIADTMVDLTNAAVKAPAESNGHNGRRKLPNPRDSKTFKFNIGENEGYFTVGLYGDGTPGEIFMRMSKAGSTLAGILDGWAMTFSTALQYGAPLASLCKLLKGHRFEPCGMTRDKQVPVASSIMDYVVRKLEAVYLKKVETKEIEGGSGCFCPECDSEMLYVSNCLTCVKCGFSRCG